MLGGHSINHQDSTAAVLSLLFDQICVCVSLFDISQFKIEQDQCVTQRCVIDPHTHTHMHESGQCDSGDLLEQGNTEFCA